MTLLVPPPPRPPVFTRPPTTALPTTTPHTLTPTTITAQSPSAAAGGGTKGGGALKTGTKSGPKPVFPASSTLQQQGSSGSGEGSKKGFAMTIIPLGVNKDGAKTLRDRLLGQYTTV